MSETSTELKVLEAYTRDIGRGIARIDYPTMEMLKINSGDTIFVRGKVNTVAKALPLYPSDEGKGIIRFDGLVRENSKTAIGNTVIIEKAKNTVLQTVSVKPLEAIPPLDERYLADALEAVPLSEGDVCMIPYFGGRIRFQVLKVKPEGYGLVNQKTVFTIDVKPPAKVYRVYGAMDVVAHDLDDAETKAKEHMSTIFEIAEVNSS